MANPDERDPVLVHEADRIARGTADLLPEETAEVSVSAMRPRLSPSRLSQRQLLLWLQETISPGYSTLERVLRLDMTGIDPDRFARAFETAVEATDAMRTLVEEDDTGSPTSRVASFPVPCKISHGVPRNRVPLGIALDVEKPLDLSRSAYASTLYTDGDQSSWCLRVHPIAADTVSLRQLTARIARAYAGKTVPRDESFVRFLERERDYFSSPEAEEDARVWATRLDAPRALPSFYGVTPKHDQLGVRRHHAFLAPKELRRLRALAAAEDLPAVIPSAPQMLALLATVLFGYLYLITRTPRLGLGVPIDVRAEDGVGPMTEICPLEIDVDGRDTFRTILDRVQADLHETVPRVRQAIDNRFGNVVYDAVLEVVDLRFETIGTSKPSPFLGPGVLFQRFPSTNVRRDFASVSVQVGRLGGGALRLAFDLAKDAFGKDEQKHAPEHFVAVLRAMLNDLDTVLDDIDLLTDEERQQVTVLDTAKPNQSVVEAVLARADARPEHPAVEFADTTLDYATTIDRARRLASHLVSLGVKKETRVAFCLDRSEELPIVMLGIQFAGAAFVPLDPTHPAARTNTILESANPTVVLTTSDLAARIPLPNDAEIVCIDEVSDSIDASKPIDVVHPDPSQLAYLIYTSGSTGKPKGVAIEHRALANLLASMAENPGLAEDDRLLAVTTPSFDISILELLLPLYTGGTVVVASRETTLDPAALQSALRDRRISVMQATPATWHGLVSSGWEGDPDLRVLCGGEAFPPDLAASLLERAKSVHNVYGPTETTIWSAVHHVTEPAKERVPIGTPIEDTELYVATSSGRLVPAGVTGELLIGGDGLARGYVGAAGLTDERFVPHPLADGRLVYRTGDLARVRSDGTFECLGRLDDQVKVRGFRIELAEIELALREHPAVLDAAAVVARTEDAMDQRIVAYAVPVSGATVPPAKELREHLAKTLPAFMLPSSFVVLSALPRTPNNKIDRKMLRPPEPSRTPEAPTQPPRNDLELRIATVWTEMLGIDEVGIDDRFFDLGGHSLNAVAMISKLRESLGANVPVAEFFERPTIAALAEQLGSEVAPAPHASVVPLVRRGEGTPLFCVCGLHIYQDLARALFPSRPVYGVLSPTEIEFLADSNPETLPSVEALASEYLDAIRRERPHGPYTFAGVSFGGLLAYEVARQAVAAGEEVQCVVLLDAILERAIRRPASKKLATRVIEALRRHRPKPGDTVDTMSELRSETYDARARAYETSMPSYDGNVLVIRARDNEDIGYPIDEDLGWGPSVDGKLEIHEVPGGHLGILAGSNARVLAQAIAPYL